MYKLLLLLFILPWVYRNPRDDRFELTPPPSLENFVRRRNDDEESEEEEEDTVWTQYLDQGVLQTPINFTGTVNDLSDGFVYSSIASPFAENWEEFLDRLPNGSYIFRNTNLINNIQYTYPTSEFDTEADDDAKYHFVKIHSEYIVQKENKAIQTKDVFDMNRFWFNTIDHTIPHIIIRFVLFHRFMRLIPLNNAADTAELTRDVIDITMFWKWATEPIVEIPIRSFQGVEILEDNLQKALQHYPIIFK